MPTAFLDKLRSFSPNARLYILHVMGMDAIYGSWAVIFNLYLLAVGFPVTFVGIRILVNSLSEAIVSIPAGFISNRIGRKWSFILGDGMGATMAIVSILSKNGPVLLAAAVVSGMFTALHSNSEPAFMAENSRADERVYLFSYASGFRTVSATIGALVAGWVTLAYSHLVGDVIAYREGTIFGIGLWFLSLVPAILLKSSRVERTVRGNARYGGRSVSHPDRIRRLAFYAGLTALSSGLIVPLYNVYFHQALSLSALTIAVIFAIGGIILAISTFYVPRLENKWGAVRSIVSLRLAGVPFIMALGLLPQLTAVMPVAAPLIVFYAGRHLLMNVVHPLASAFGMNILDPQERSVATGAQTFLSNVAWALAAYTGSLMLRSHGYLLLFTLSGIVALGAQWSYYHFFSRVRPQVSDTATARIVKP